MTAVISPNTAIGDYTVISKIGEGGMGEVWRARDTKLGRDVAIKVLPPAFASSSERLRRFEQEAQAAGSLNHPNILVIYHIGTHGGSPYIASELLQGETLRELLQNGALSQRKALDYAFQLAIGLGAAHEKGIIHRDIKPENVFITDDGRVKILDFGLAKLSSTYESSELQTDIPTRKVNTDPGTVMGTLGYMSPEQLKGRIADQRSDIFSLGAILYEMIAGKRAFRGESSAETMSAILREDPPDLSETNKNVSPSLERIVFRCLEKNPGQRFHSANDLAFAIEALTAQSLRSGEASLLSAVDTDKHLITAKPRWLQMLVAALVLMMLGVLAFFAVKYFNASSDAKEVVKFSVIIPEKTWMVIDVEQHNISVSPDGKQVAFIAESEGQRRVYLRSLDQLSVRALQGSERAYSPFWSPDSRYVAFFAEGKLKKIDINGGPVQTICDAPKHDTNGAWGSDGTILFPAFEGDSGTLLYEVNAANGSTSKVTLNRVEPQWVSFLSQSRNFIFYGLGETKELYGFYAGSVGSRDVKLIAPMSKTRVEYASPGFLLFVREGALVAQPFDANSMSLTGEPRMLAERIPYFDKTGFAEFSVSQSGTLVYASDTQQTNLTWVDRSGRELGKVGGLDRFSTVALSPNEKQIAVTISDTQTGSGDIWIYDINGGRNRFAFGPRDDADPFWSPDGKRIAYFTNGKSTLRIKDINDVNGEGESPVEKGFIGISDWSADGRYLIYSLNEPTMQRDAWVLPLGGDRKPFPFLQSPASEWGCKFSPDGKFVAFNSDESGSTEVYLARFDNPKEKFRVSVSGGSGPRWSGSGRELFYVSSDGHVMAAPFNSSDSLPVGSPTPLFEAYDLLEYDAAADGQKFIVVKSVASLHSAPIQVTLNWSELLKQNQQR